MRLASRFLENRDRVVQATLGRSWNMPSIFRRVRLTAMVRRCSWIDVVHHRTGLSAKQAISVRIGTDLDTANVVLRAYRRRHQKPIDRGSAQPGSALRAGFGAPGVSCRFRNRSSEHAASSLATVRKLSPVRRMSIHPAA